VHRDILAERQSSLAERQNSLAERHKISKEAEPLWTLKLQPSKARLQGQAEASLETLDLVWQKTLVQGGRVRLILALVMPTGGQKPHRLLGCHRQDPVVKQAFKAMAPTFKLSWNQDVPSSIPAAPQLANGANKQARTSAWVGMHNSPALLGSSCKQCLLETTRVCTCLVEFF